MRIAFAFFILATLALIASASTPILVYVSATALDDAPKAQYIQVTMYVFPTKTYIVAQVENGSGYLIAGRISSILGIPPFWIVAWEGKTYILFETTSNATEILTLLNKEGITVIVMAAGRPATAQPAPAAPLPLLKKTPTLWGKVKRER